MEQESGGRCYENGKCPFHNMLQEQVNKSLPRWVFISAFGTMVMLALVFAGWHVKSLAAFDNKYEKKIEQVESNRELLIELRTNQVHLMKYFGLKPVEDKNVQESRPIR